MAEPRARQRNKGQLFPAADLADLLYAYGDNPYPPGPPQPPRSLSTTISTLDEILTDFIIETCHAAALCASYSRRQKIKVEDFKWVLRRDERLLGRAMEVLWREKMIKEARKAFDDTDKVEGEEALQGVAKAGGVEGEVKKPGRGRKKRKAEGDEGVDAKRRAS